MEADKYNCRGVVEWSRLDILVTSTCDRCALPSHIASIAWKHKRKKDRNTKKRHCTENTRAKTKHNTAVGPRGEQFSWGPVLAQIVTTETMSDDIV